MITPIGLPVPSKKIDAETISPPTEMIESEGVVNTAPIEFDKVVNASVEQIESDVNTEGLLAV